eukprot:TRINITY_DN39812_c0_g1_i1.p1 TRINITY_DN39812_c0_g1~~TRINITY_DN39812_c0_g1_i1.p1  ORF type:complete len:915 (-),score=239.75 TRINITY_DN39812_c0_g1_i1:80-2713(-)
MEVPTDSSREGVTPDRSFLSYSQLLRVIRTCAGNATLDDEFCSMFLELETSFPQSSSPFEYLASLSESIKTSQKDAMQNIVLFRHAKDRLQAELESLTAKIGELQQQVKRDELRQKVVDSILEEVSKDESWSRTVGKKEATLRERVNDFLWFMENAKSLDDKKLSQGFDAFYEVVAPIEEYVADADWEAVIKGAVQLLEWIRPDFQLRIVRILSELCRWDEALDIFMDHDGVGAIAVLLRSVNDELRGTVAGLISTISRSHPKRIESKECLEAIIKLCYSENEYLLERSTETLWSLLISENLRLTAIEFGAIDAILQLLDVDNDTVLENACIALGYLTRVDEAKDAMREKGGLKMLLDLLDVGVPDSCASKVAGALWNCASNDINKVAIREIGGIAVLVKVLDSSEMNVLENVTGALWNLAVEKQSKSKIREEGGMVKLIRLLDVGKSSEGLLENVTGTLWNCSADMENRVVLRKLNGLHLLLDYLKDEKIPTTVRVNCAGCIRNCSVNDHNKAELRKIGALPIFLTLLENPNFVDKIVSTLWICSIDKQNKIELVEHKAVAKLAALLPDADDALSEKILGTLKNLAGSDVAHVHLVDHLPVIEKVRNEFEKFVEKGLVESSATSFCVALFSHMVNHDVSRLVGDILTPGWYALIVSVFDVAVQLGLPFHGHVANIIRVMCETDAKGMKRGSGSSGGGHDRDTTGGQFVSAGLLRTLMDALQQRQQSEQKQQSSSMGSDFDVLSVLNLLTTLIPHVITDKKFQMDPNFNVSILNICSILLPLLELDIESEHATIISVCTFVASVTIAKTSSALSSAIGELGFLKPLLSIIEKSGRKEEPYVSVRHASGRCLQVLATHPDNATRLASLTKVATPTSSS